MTKKALSVIVFSLALQGCFDVYEANKPIEERIMETNRTVSQKVRNQPIDPTKITLTELGGNIIYVQQGRDPFIPDGVLSVLTPIFPGVPAFTYTRIPVDPTRPAGYKSGPFENYEIGTITMIGVMSQPNGVQAALIDVGENKILMLHEGDYIGKDHGLVTKITENKISIDEKRGAPTRVTPNAWVVQPNEINLQIK